MIAGNPDGKKMIIAAANANEMWSRGEADRAASAVAESPADSILVVDCAIPFSVAETAAQVTGGRQFSVVLDPSPPERVGGDLYPVTDFITPNRDRSQRVDRNHLAIARRCRPGRSGSNQAWNQGSVYELDNGGCVVVTADSATVRPDSH
jgi:hypothetical protein